MTGRRGLNRVIWLTIVGNGFASVHPGVMAHRTFWNIDRVFVARRET